ncbi:MAG TPA: alpha/beta fold hydrolase [Spongiibacteraceae bacterium]|jgi:hypothetical protein
MLVDKKLLRPALIITSVALIILAAAALSPTLLVESRDVYFSSRNASFSGTLLIPRGRQIVAAIVLVHGSGKAERMTWLGRIFALRGIATLTYDKRGVGQSAGVYTGPEVGTENVSPENLDLLADDAAAAMQTLVGELRDVPVGFVGISQAGWIIPLAAMKSRTAKFIVLWSGPVSTTYEQRIFQNLTQEASDFWNQHTQAEVRELMSKAGDNFLFGDTDPRDALRQLSIPGLWLFGGRDSAIPVELSIVRLTGIAREKNSKFEYRLFPSYQHDLGNLGRDIVDTTVAWIKSSINEVPITP